MTFSPTIQSYVGTHSGSFNYAVAIDWARNRIFMGETYVARYGLLTGLEETWAALPSYMQTDDKAIGLSPAGDLYANMNGLPGSSGGMQILDQTTFAVKYSVPYTVASAYSGSGYGVVTSGSTTYIADASITPVTTSVRDSGSGLAVANYVDWSYGDTCLTTVAGAAFSGKVFQILSETPSGPTGLQLVLQQIQFGVGSSVTSTIGSITPTQVDAAWANIGCGGGCLDQADGNLIVAVFGAAGSTQVNYIVKVNVQTAAIMWVHPIYNETVTPLQPGPSMAYSSIKNQRFGYLLSSDARAVVINTATGTIVSNQTTGYAGVGCHQTGFCYNDTLGCIVGQLNYLEQSGSPAPLNSTPSSFSGWGALYIAAPIAPSPPPGTPGGPATSRKRAWAFVLDGHTFYVLDMGNYSTWVYDITTQQWSNFYTSGYVQWDVVNGVMWGDRIIGGDLATDNIWEVAATAIQDSDAYDVPHVVTGGLATRSRTYRSLDSLRLAISFGDTQDPTGSVVSMAFSDDNGNSYSANFPIAITEGNFSMEVAWTSMGSFAAPGRIFQISDSGGPMRIDGCDAFIDDFDNEQIQESPSQ